LIAGFLVSRMPKQTVFSSAGFSSIVGSSLELIQLFFIFFFSCVLLFGVTFVRFISSPIIFGNSLGTFIFLSILMSTFK
ncbi:sensor histidine kinase, partial [Enterococcus faecalis]|uniref:LytS/YhcK type 5TM receptor domain-containing protein n=1 Tax=Enterococcus faecalis TaxID=1351 RepID=UPI002958559C